MSELILVIGKTKKSSHDKLDLILGEFKYKEIESINKNNYLYTISLKNGNKYIAIPGLDNAIRGMKFDKVLLEVGLNKKLIETYVLPFISDLSNIEYWEVNEILCSTN